MTPNPNGCRLCGIDQRGHAIQTGPDGTHTWQPPTDEQIKNRMQARHSCTPKTPATVPTPTWHSKPWSPTRKPPVRALPLRGGKNAAPAKPSLPPVHL